MAASTASGFHRPLLLAAAVLLSGGALQAAPADPPYPATATLRALQLATFDCGRDNSAAACDRARADSDSLLDHPRLPGRCKDILWEIRQKATVAPVNNLARREPIDAAGREVVVACRPLSRPAPITDTPPAALPGGGGGPRFGFGSGGAAP
jgi:hypothetical protein